MLSRIKKLCHASTLHQKSMLASKREVVSGIVWLVIFAAIMLAGAKLIGISAIQDKIAKAGIFGPLVLILAKASTIVFAPLGGGPLYLVAAPIFGFTKGFISIFLGDMLGSSLAFYISKFFGRKVMRKLLSDGGMKYVDDILYHLGSWKGLVYARVILVGLPEAVSYAAGLTKLPFLLFGLITGLVYFVFDFVLVALGKTLLSNTYLAMGALWGGSAVIVIAGFYFIGKRKRK